jgi:hypothetical protein
VLGDKRIRDLSVGHHRARHRRTQLRRRTVGHALVRHEQVERIVHDRGHCHRIHRLQHHLLDRPDIMQHPMRVVLRRLIHAHPDHLSTGS